MKQETRRPGRCRGLTQTLQCNLPDQAGSLLFGKGTGHVGIDESGRDNVDRDAARTDFTGERFRECNDAGLGRRIVGLAGISGRANHRCNADNAALARFHHAAHDRLRGTKNRTQVGIQDGLPILILHAHQQLIPGDSGIVDQNGDRTEFGCDRRQ